MSLPLHHLSGPLYRCKESLRIRDQNGFFSLPLLFADIGIVAWLLVAFHQFQNLPWPPPVTGATSIVAVSGLAWLCGLHRNWRACSFTWLLRALLFILLSTGALHLLLHNIGEEAFNIQLAWLAVALSVGLFFARAIYWKLRSPGDWAPLETLRWVLLGVAGTWVLWPLYNVKPSGAGDAYWYMMMLSDYLEQLRHGIFPVWIGQTEYAFNGAFSPLRLAPGFQHAGGLLDILTGQSLEYLALKNSMLAVNALAAAFFAYFCLRSILPQRANTACGLALVYVLSPGLLTPLIKGDQYMTFFAAPYLPIALYGCWRSFTRNDVAGHVFLGAAIGALWLFHTPVALWTSFFAAGIYTVKLILHRRSFRELKMTFLSMLVYILLGTYPIFSALSLDNVAEMHIESQSIISEIKTVFPAIFKPLVATRHTSNYQPGYAALAAGLLGLGLSIYRRNAAGLAFASSSCILACLLLPLPGLNAFLWNHMPLIVMKVTNVWVYQRFALIWVALLIFTLAAALADLPALKPDQGWFRFGVFLIALIALVWTGREASLLRAYCKVNISSDTSWVVNYAKHNLILSRYSYSSFEKAPSYFSHAYMEPRLESRLLRRDDHEIFLSNADSAASQGAGRSLVAEGVFRAVSITNSPFYLLNPAPTLEPNLHYALRMEFLTPGENGYLQIRGVRLFREYILPDSGAGMGINGSPRAFGTTPTSSRIVPLFSDASNPVLLQLLHILPEREEKTEFDAARYQLWSYEPEQLPISVHSLLPYRASVESPEPAYLESPRMWLSGYRARVDNIRVPVLRSPNNLCMIEVKTGHNEIEIKYKPPLRVEVSYWITIWSWGALLSTGLWSLLRRTSLQS